MGSFSIWHWLIVLAIIILVLGGKKLKSLGSDLGESIKNFKKSIQDDNHSTPPKQDKE